MTKMIRRIKELGPLQDLLLKCCPPDGKGRRSIPLLAKQLDMTAYGVYKWIGDGHVPSKRIFELITLAKGAVTWEEFLPYVFNKHAEKVAAKKK
ncbi:MAG: hypothetical protein ACREA9_29745 [Pyrinomonadaceae bacterium]